MALDKMYIITYNLLMIKTLPITKARDNFPDIVDRADRLLDEYVITVNGEPKAVLMSVHELESLKETLEIISNPKLMKNLREADNDVEKKNYIPWEDAKKELNL